MRIDQPDEDGGRADDADTPDTPDTPDANEARAPDRERAVPAAAAGEHEAYRAIVDAVFRAHAIDQACYPEDRYTEGVHADCGRLANAGFEHIDRRNLWAGEEYKGVNSRWRVPDSGQLFEVQFHTQASLDAKEETHGAYEQIRSLPDDDNEVGKLHAYQREVTATIPTPPGAPGIPDYP